jgi:hypothetical protein
VEETLSEAWMAGFGITLERKEPTIRNQSAIIGISLSPITIWIVRIEMAN